MLLHAEPHFLAPNDGHTHGDSLRIAARALVFCEHSLADLVQTHWLSYLSTSLSRASSIISLARDISLL